MCLPLTIPCGIPRPSWGFFGDSELGEAPWELKNLKLGRDGWGVVRGRVDRTTSVLVSQLCVANTE